MKTIVCLIFLMLANLALADGGDSRIQRINYQKETISKIYSVIGRVILIQFEPGETLQGESSGVGLGDARAWVNLVARGNNVWLKQSAENPNTNLTIVTNRRTYLFDLVQVTKLTAATYAVFFRYPDTEMREAEQKANVDAATAAVKGRISQAEKLAAEQQKIAKENALSKIKINTDYSVRGDAEMLTPTGIYDDGRFTYLEYADARPLPVFYKVLSDGTEALINGSMSQDRKTYVLHDVVPKIIARLGRDLVIEINNQNYQTPSLNETGTSSPGLIRTNR
jgi:type IV secretion system protein VirB9